MDVRPGGVWKHVMYGPDGTNYPNSSVFMDVVKPERIVFSRGGGKEGGPGAHYESTWSFDAVDGDKTRVTIRMVFPSAADRDLVVRIRRHRGRQTDSGMPGGTLGADIKELAMKYLCLCYYDTKAFTINPWHKRGRRFL